MLIRIAVVVWLALVAASAVLPAQTEATGDGFTRGTNRIGVFLAWHGAALLVAIVIWMIGRRDGNEPGWLVNGPLIVHGLVVVGLVLYTVVQLISG